MKNKFPLDLSKFKKISSDKQTTTLKHPEGHEIKIAHSALSPKMRSQLAEMEPHMVNGGEVPDLDPEKAKQFSKGASESGVQPSEWMKNLKEGLGINKEPKPKASPTNNYADGGDVQSQSSQDSPDQIAQDAQAEAPQQQAPVVVNVNGGAAPTQQPDPSAAHAIGSYIGNGVRQALADTGKAVGAIASPIVNAGSGLMNGLVGSPPPEAQNAAPAQAPNPQGGLAQPSPQAPRIGSQDPYGTVSQEQAFLKGLGEQKAGLFDEANAMGAQGKAEVAALNQAQDRQNALMATYKEHYDGLDKERQAFMSDIQNQHIDPQHYLNSMGVGQRIRTTIGLILGGFGALAGQDNMAMKFLNDNISRDIDAQKSELGKNENLLSANMRQFGNLRDASDMTRVMQNDIVSNQLKQAAASAMSPMAKARALQAAGKLDAESAPLLGQIAMRKSLLSGMYSGQVSPSRVIMALVPESEKQAAYKELQQAENTVSVRDNLLSSFDKLNELNTIGNRGAHLGFQPPQVGAILDPLLASLSKDTAGRFTAADAEMLRPLFPSPGNSPESVATKRSQMIKLITEKMHFPMLEPYGIDVKSMGRYNNQGESTIPRSAPVTK